MAVRCMVSSGGDWIAVAVDFIPAIFFLMKLDGEWVIAHVHRLAGCPVCAPTSADELLISLATHDEETIVESKMSLLSFDGSKRAVQSETPLDLDAAAALDSDAVLSVDDVFATDELRKAPMDHNYAGQKLKFELFDEREQMKKRRKQEAAGRIGGRPTTTIINIIT